MSLHVSVPSCPYFIPWYLWTTVQNIIPSGGFMAIASMSIPWCSLSSAFGDTGMPAKMKGWFRVHTLGSETMVGFKLLHGTPSYICTDYGACSHCPCVHDQTCWCHKVWTVTHIISLMVMGGAYIIPLRKKIMWLSPTFLSFCYLSYL